MFREIKYSMLTCAMLASPNLRSIEGECDAPAATPSLSIKAALSSSVAKIRSISAVKKINSIYPSKPISSEDLQKSIDFLIGVESKIAEEGIGSMMLESQAQGSTDRSSILFRISSSMRSFKQRSQKRETTEVIDISQMNELKLSLKIFFISKCRAFANSEHMQKMQSMHANKFLNEIVNLRISLEELHKLNKAYCDIVYAVLKIRSIIENGKQVIKLLYSSNIRKSEKEQRKIRLLYETTCDAIFGLRDFIESENPSGDIIFTRDFVSEKLLVFNHRKYRLNGLGHSSEAVDQETAAQYLIFDIFGVQDCFKSLKISENKIVIRDLVGVTKFQESEHYISSAIRAGRVIAQEIGKDFKKDENKPIETAASIQKQLDTIGNNAQRVRHKTLCEAVRDFFGDST